MMNGKKLTIAVVIVLILAVTGAAYAEDLLTPPAQQGQNGAVQQGPGMMGRGRMGGQMMRPGMAGGPGGGQLMMRLLRGLVRGELLIQGGNGKLQRIRIDRGTVTEAAATEIKITEKDGRKLTLAIDGDTKILGKKIEEIQKGDRVEAIRVKKSGVYKAAVIVVRPKPAGQPLGDLFGGGGPAPQGSEGATDSAIF